MFIVTRRLCKKPFLEQLCARYQPPKQYPFLTLPNALTLARVASLPLFVGSYYCAPTSFTCVFFLATALTDYVDGYLARRLNLHSKLGATLDPVADKLQVCTTLTLLCSTYATPLITLPAVIIVSRELAVCGMREYCALTGEKLSVSSMGKTKTALQMAALLVLLANKDSERPPTLGEVLLVASAATTVFSGVQYGQKFITILQKIK